MKLTSHRLFIGKIPPGTSEDELRKEFSAYGNIESLEIKTKTNAVNDSVEIFGFVTLQTEDHIVPQCIDEFQRQPYKGVYLHVSRAKESFLEKLKREREEAEAQKNRAPLLDPYKKPAEDKHVKEPVVPLPTLPTLSKGKDSSSSESSESESDEEPVPVARKSLEIARAASRPQPPKEEDEIVKKWNQETYIEYGKLKIVPITGQIAEVIDRTKSHQKRSEDKKLGETARIADEKRKQGLSNLKSAYEQQQLAIKSALAGDSQNSKKKITFDDDDTPGQQKLSLFDAADDEEDDGFRANFSVRKQMLGEEGQKLYEMQTSFQADNRFRLDDRFLEDTGKPVEPKQKGKQAKERMKQLEILSNVTGKPISVENRTNNKTSLQMQRFDPLQQKESEQNETPEPLAKESERKKAERRADDFKVSEEKFYKVADNFTISSQPQSQGFSLLAMFGKATQNNKDSAMVVERMQEETPLKSDIRFRYESSDSEEDGETKPKGSKKQKKQEVETQKAGEESKKGKKKNKIKGKKQTGPGYYTKQGIWKESFFFIPNDPRLDVGREFLGFVKDGEGNLKTAKEAVVGLTEADVQDIRQLYKKRRHRENRFVHKESKLGLKRLKKKTLTLRNKTSKPKKVK